MDFRTMNDMPDTPRRGMLLALAGLGAIPAAGVVASRGIARSPASQNDGEVGAAAGGEWLNVRSFGARCDGRSDDSAAVQATIDAACAVPLPPPIAVPGTCLLTQPIRVRRPVDTAKAVLRIVGMGPGAGFRSGRKGAMFVGGSASDGSPGTEFVRFEAVRFEGTSPIAGPVMSGDFLRISFTSCEFIGIACMVSERYAQEWRFIGCIARGWRGPFFAAAGGYGVTSSNSKYQFGGPAFRLVDPTLRKSGCVGCSFMQDIYEGSIGPFLEFELGKGVSIAGLYAEDIENPTIVVGARARSSGVSITGCFFGTRPDNVKAADFGEIMWNNVSGGASIGNVAVGRLHHRDGRAVDFVSLGDHDGVAP